MSVTELKALLFDLDQDSKVLMQILKAKLAEVPPTPPIK